MKKKAQILEKEIWKGKYGIYEKITQVIRALWAFFYFVIWTYFAQDDAKQLHP